MTAREAAAKTVSEVLDSNVPSHIAISAMVKRNADWNLHDRGFAKRLTEGTVRMKIPIDYLLERQSKTPLNKMKPWIRSLLRCGVYQIVYCEDIPHSAACNEAVKLAKKYGYTNLSAYVNGVLRSIAREGNVLLEHAKNSSRETKLQLQYGLPMWLIKQWERDYGEETAETIAAAQVTIAPLTVRCNLSKTTLPNLCASLKQSGVEAIPASYAENTLHLIGCEGMEALPAYQNGWFQIQDESSVLVGQVAGIKGTENVLDLCAAPGGKTLHIADLLAYHGGAKKGKVEARDVSEQKLSLIRENIARTGFGQIHLRLSDATVFDESAENQYDLVLADVPCSGTGVIGRKPDIKHNMTEEKQKELVALQRKILSNAVKYVRPGGVLLFCTCTLNQDENDNGRMYLIEQGMRPDDLRPYLPECLHNENTRNGWIQIIPGVHRGDGFYICRLIKPNKLQK